jgi:hypothetical protein
MPAGDLLLDRIEAALAATRASDAFESAASACLRMLKRDTRRFRDGYRALLVEMLSDALRSPEMDRRLDVLDALVMCRRTVLGPEALSGLA